MLLDRRIANVALGEFDETEDRSDLPNSVSSQSPTTKTERTIRRTAVAYIANSRDDQPSFG